MIQNGFGKYNPADMKHRRASLNVPKDGEAFQPQCATSFGASSSQTRLLYSDFKPHKIKKNK